ncbi:hypothetical protein CPLU01_14778 [Colletotrichum plurivorum]|uniref:Uncharacterized protein n=1 Tax=Colletotrichum plurivorum TaxID=2175906 RepID=A0A8H6JI09_9PEZI|nr:hypothetical protein CPLU01_14778 [Colletotrichum plurivorum]
MPGRGGSSARNVDQERHRQYYQGVSISDLHGLGCGFHLLGSPKVPFQAPFACDGSFEVMSGTEGVGSGGIRLCGPQEEGDIIGDVFLIPFQHVVPHTYAEQIIVLPNPRKPAKKAEAYLVVIVPTAATGASAVKREYPQIISFSWPDRAADKKLAGKVGEAADGKKDTYLSVMKRVFDEQLAPFGKSVVDVSGQAGNGHIIGKETVLKPPMGGRLQHDVKGLLHFLETGVLFTSESLRVYIPFAAFRGAMLVLAREMKDGGNGRIAALSVLCRANEPFYQDDENGETLMSFGRVDSGLAEAVKEYMERHGIAPMMCQQMFYDYENGQPASGFMPLMM